MPSVDLTDPKSKLAAIRKQYARVISVESLQEVQSQFMQDDIKRLLVREDLASFKRAYLQLLTTIDYVHPSKPIISPYAGVAEKDIDCDNPDFDGVLCLAQPNELEAIPQNVQIPAVQLASNYRDFDILDHGTAVAGLIGAKHTEFNGTGLAAPEVSVVPISTVDPQIGEDIRSAYVQLNVRIFNLSLSFPVGQMPNGLAKRMNSNVAGAYTNALFVVAATDDGNPVCGTTMTYPICWGVQPNVIVVAASLLEGTALVQNGGGDAWGSKYVHIAAPGIGFGAPARNKSYVPVGGTSFAAPLVAATAALLFEQGVYDPTLIKQRIISTARVIQAYKGQVSGGLLDVKRAVSSPGSGVLIDAGGKEKTVQVVPTTMLYLKWGDGGIHVPIKCVLRMTLTRNGSYRVVYQDPSDRTQLRIQEEVTADQGQPWRIRYVENGSSGSNQGIVNDLIANYTDYVGPVL
jgi:subtilisin family serine protease